MSIFNILNTSGPERNKGFFKLLAWVIGIAGLFLAGNLLFPEIVSVVLNVIWIILITVVIIFFSLGVLVIVGLRKEASKILDVLLEGSLTFLDLLDFIKLIYRRFIEIIKDFILYCAPVFAYVTALLIYILLIVLYKYVGKTYDITILTIFLTVSLVASVAFLNKPKLQEVVVLKWMGLFNKSFHKAFIDALEVVLFMFFLTMDSKNLFFLPDNLKVELHANLFGYNLITKSFIINDHLKFTVTLIVISITLEIIRNILKIIVTARRYYSEGVGSIDTYNKYSKSALIKVSLRKSFVDTKDDIVKFITFTTILFAVFMIFPRLKIFTLVLASTTNLIMDLLIPTRFLNVRGTDLINRILIKVFKL